MRRRFDLISNARNLMRRTSFRYAASFLGFSIMTMIYTANAFTMAPSRFFSTFQIDSEALVVSNIVADRVGLKKEGFHLGSLAIDGVVKYPDSILESYKIFREGSAGEALSFSSYRSSLGIQGWFFSWVARLFDVRHIGTLYRANAILLSCIVMVLFSLYRRIYDRNFAWIFLLGLVGSPWVVAFARNLYWVPFLWFLPSVFSGLLLLARNRWQRFVFAGGIVAAVFLKSATGYEYLSSITLLAVSPFLAAPLFEGHWPSRRSWLFSAIVFMLCVFGFALALVWHASLRGDTIIDGLLNIYEYDVKRRTWGSGAAFEPVFQASLQSSVWTVLKTYFFDWKTPFLFNIPGNGFPIFVVSVLVVLVYRIIRGRLDRWTQPAAFLLFLSIPLSWYVLMKGHSYIHTGMNFVLWYFGFVQFCLSVVWKQLRDAYGHITASK